MARIAGVVLPENKRIEYALTYVYGIGLKSAQDILNKLKISYDKRTRELSNDEVGSLQSEITNYYVTEGDLRKEIMLNIKRLQEIGCYRGSRHKKGLPARGQRTKTNARTRKGPRRAGGAVALKKKVTKK
ncbi:MAG: 30S ribosomal protein S13 [Candidatus Babeliales bacterium]|nr:30S ribosomal protein S13 [Candidatus Babeliales bacterium]